VSSAPPQGAPRRSPIALALSDSDGNLRTPLILGIVVVALALLAIGMFAALLAAGAGSPATLAIWMVGALILIKLPLLAVVWWIISRRRDEPSGGGWSSKECGEILAYLEQQADESRERGDAAARLAYFAREAWFVADSARDADKAEAVAVAVRIDAMANRAGAGRRVVSDGPEL
jgi:flagellar basal body-associated protein FliL